MRQPLRTLALPLVAAVVVLAAGTAHGQSVADLEKQLRDQPTTLRAKEALAEAYLHECELEKSLALWREVLKAEPDHARARHVVERLTLQKLDLDAHLGILETLIEKGITDGTSAQLEAAAERAATDAQKAQVLYLRGELAQVTGAEADARSAYEAARLYGGTPGAGRAAIALAMLDWRGGDADQARQLLRGIVENDALEDAVVRETAALRLAEFGLEAGPRGEGIEALRNLIGRLATAEVRREAWLVLAGALRAGLDEGRYGPEAVAAFEAALSAEPPNDQASRVLDDLLTGVRSGLDAPTLDRLLELLDRIVFENAVFARRSALLRVEALLARAAFEDRVADVSARTQAAHEVLDALAAADPADVRRLGRLRGRAHLVEAQKRIALEGAGGALPILVEAKRHYLKLLAADPGEPLRRLRQIGTLLELAHEPHMAVSLHREIAVRFPHRPEGRDALLRAARLQEKELDAPLDALGTYAEYAARYPAELAYRQLEIGARLRRLGYANVLDFQKRNHLKPDGIVGPKTRKVLEQVEEAFDLVRLRDGAPEAPLPVLPPEKRSAAPRLAGGAGHGDSPVLRGEFVHPRMFAIARGLEDAGRHYDAVVAYRLFLNLFPTKKEADDSLIAVARLFRDNLLFEEALGAYEALMADYPDGDRTSLAYIEAAACNENLGRWAEAKELYELYIKKFPHYEHVGLCEGRLALLDEVQQYADFIADNPQNPKVAEAQYQIATLFHKQFKNYTKAAVEFRKVAERHPKHVRAPDALFTGGTAQLRAENFPAARDLFTELAEGYPDSRLADDALYWIGHTYEYTARSVGKLDEARIILKRRSLRDRVRLVADLDLRRLYHPEAGPGPEVAEEVWGGDTLGVLVSGSKRDRVNADLFRAIRAYRRTVEEFKRGDMAGDALLRIGVIYTQYLKDPEKGIEAYQELLAHYPASKEAVDALHKVGEYYLEKKRYDEAIEAYQKFIYNYPQHEKAERAMLAIARCWAEQKVWDKALDAYQSYLSKFPEGEQAEFAQAQVAWIRMYHF